MYHPFTTRRPSVSFPRAGREELVDGRPAAVRAYLRHFWSHWSGPTFEPDDRRLDHLVEVYGSPEASHAFAAAIKGRLAPG